jgi:hypothetical protein
MFSALAYVDQAKIDDQLLLLLLLLLLVVVVVVVVVRWAGHVARMGEGERCAQGSGEET